MLLGNLCLQSSTYVSRLPQKRAITMRARNWGVIRLGATFSSTAEISQKRKWRNPILVRFDHENVDAAVLANGEGCGSGWRAVRSILTDDPRRRRPSGVPLLTPHSRSNKSHAIRLKHRRGRQVDHKDITTTGAGSGGRVHAASRTQIVAA
jgi:hypothetical protein